MLDNWVNFVVLVYIDLELTDNHLIYKINTPFLVMLANNYFSSLKRWWILVEDYLYLCEKGIDILCKPMTDYFEMIAFLIHRSLKKMIWLLYNILLACVYHLFYWMLIQPNNIFTKKIYIICWQIAENHYLTINILFIFFFYYRILIIRNNL